MDSVSLQAIFAFATISLFAIVAAYLYIRLFLIVSATRKMFYLQNQGLIILVYYFNELADLKNYRAHINDTPNPLKTNTYHLAGKMFISFCEMDKKIKLEEIGLREIIEGCAPAKPIIFTNPVNI